MSGSNTAMVSKIPVRSDEPLLTYIRSIDRRNPSRRFDVSPTAFSASFLSLIMNGTCTGMEPLASERSPSPALPLRRTRRSTSFVRRALFLCSLLNLTPFSPAEFTQDGADPQWTTRFTIASSTGAVSRVR